MVGFWVVVGLLLAGCGAKHDPGSGGSPSPAAAESGTITVTTAMHPGTDGSLYIEGALAQVTVKDDAGNVVDKQVKMPGQQMTFPDLPPGTYQILAALRPCDANCGYLDPATDRCQQSIDVDGDRGLEIDFTVGKPCTFA